MAMQTYSSVPSRNTSVNADKPVKRKPRRPRPQRKRRGLLNPKDHYPGIR